MANKYNTFDDFCKVFNIAIQPRLSVNRERCYFGSAPKLCVMRNVFGEVAVRSWILNLIVDLSIFCSTNVQQRLGKMQAQQITGMILSDFYYLNAAELLLFFYRFKLGDYGKFYSSFDAITLMQGLNEFCDERREIYEKKRRLDYVAEIEKDIANGVSREEYEKLKERAKNGDKDAIELLKPPKQE